MTDEDKKIQDNEGEIDTRLQESEQSDGGQADLEDDVVFEDNTEVTGADYAQKVQKLKSRIKELEKKNTELLNGWQRDKADFINSKKSEEESRKEFLKFAKADIISELLPVLDSFESAFKNKEAWEKADKNWRTGVEYIHTQLLNTLTQNGLKVINPIGEMYDHNRDEAIENIPVEAETEDGKILDVVQVGYELNGKEIRAPKVRVGNFNK